MQKCVRSRYLETADAGIYEEYFWAAHGGPEIDLVLRTRQSRNQKRIRISV